MMHCESWEDTACRRQEAKYKKKRTRGWCGITSSHCSVRATFSTRQLSFISTLVSTSFTSYDVSLDWFFYSRERNGRGYEKLRILHAIAQCSRMKDLVKKEGTRVSVEAHAHKRARASQDGSELGLVTHLTIMFC